MKKDISIFTPTYNRASTLKNCYDSLKNQTYKNFCWLIVDDGSTDETESLVENWKKENVIDIQYLKKQNGGKHTAYNLAVENCKTDLIIISLDSDDTFTNNAIQIFYDNWKKRDKRKKFVGAVGLCTDQNYSSRYKYYYPFDKLKDMSLSKALSQSLFNASAIFMFQTNYLKKYTYPEINGEKFFTEAYTYYQMDESMIWLDEYVCIREFRNDGLTKNTFKSYINSPTSWYMYNVLRFKKICSKKLKIKFLIFAIAFSIMASKNIIKDCRNHLIIITLLFPIGFLLFLFLKYKGKRVIK